jgi:hypothetical protein
MSSEFAFRINGPRSAAVTPTGRRIQKESAYKSLTERIAVQVLYAANGDRKKNQKSFAATYFSAGITSVMTTNSRDFQVFGIFQIIRP